MSDPVVLLSTGDVVGPAGGVTDNSMVLFSGTSGKLIKGNNAVVTSAGLALLDDVDAAAQRTTLGLGTAATATLTTSATDTTAGRVTKVGDFGLGTTSAVISNIDSLSIPTGFYYYAAPTAGAKPSEYGTVIVTAGANGEWVMQQAHTTSNVILTRNNINNAGWTPWREIALTNSPAFIGTPTAPTAAAGTSTTQLATTAFVTATGDVRYTQRSNNLSDLSNPTVARSNLGLGTAATANLTTSNADGTVGRVLKVGDGGWMGQGQGAIQEAPYGYPSSILDVTNQTKVIRSEDLDNGVARYASGIHFAVSDTWGRLRVQHNSPGAWVQGGIAANGTGWTSQVVLSDNILQTTGSSTGFPMSQAAVTNAANLKANINSPTFTGVPSAPTPASGTRSTAIATMQNFANEFGSSFATSGWQRLPSGLIIQWGRVANASRAVDGTALGPISYPISFPNAVFAVNAQMIGGEAVGLLNLNGYLFVKTVGTSSFNLISGHSSQETFDFGVYWLAIGY